LLVFPTKRDGLIALGAFVERQPGLDSALVVRLARLVRRWPCSTPLQTVGSPTSGMRAAGPYTSSTVMIAEHRQVVAAPEVDACAVRSPRAGVAAVKHGARPSSNVGRGRGGSAEPAGTEGTPGCHGRVAVSAIGSARTR